MNNRIWHTNPHVTAERKALFDRLFDLWLANHKAPVLLTAIESPEYAHLNGLYLDIDETKSPPLWTLYSKNPGEIDRDQP